jgi:hypothetical protein
LTGTVNRYFGGIEAEECSDGGKVFAAGISKDIEAFPNPLGVSVTAEKDLVDKVSGGLSQYREVIARMNACEERIKELTRHISESNDEVERISKKVEEALSIVDKIRDDGLPRVLIKVKQAMLSERQKSYYLFAMFGLLALIVLVRVWNRT